MPTFERRDPAFVEHRDEGGKPVFTPMHGPTRWYINDEEVPAAEWALKFALHHGTVTTRQVSSDPAHDVDLANGRLDAFD